MKLPIISEDAGAKIACGRETGNYYIISDGLMSPILSPRLHEKSCSRDVHMCKKFTILYCQYLANTDCLHGQNVLNFNIVANTLPVVSQVATKLCDDHLPYTIGQHARCWLCH